MLHHMQCQNDIVFSREDACPERTSDSCEERRRALQCTRRAHMDAREARASAKGQNK